MNSNHMAIRQLNVADSELYVPAAQTIDCPPQAGLQESATNF